MFKVSTTVTAGTARVEHLKVLSLPNQGFGPETRAYARLSFRPFGKKRDLSLYFYPNDPDTVRFLLAAMEDRHTIYLEVEGLKTPIPFFDTLAHALGFRSYWIAAWDIVQMNLGDRPFRFPQ